MLLVIIFFCLVLIVCTAQVKAFVLIDKYSQKYYVKIYLFSFLCIGKFNLSGIRSKYKNKWNKNLGKNINLNFFVKHLKKITKKRLIKLEKFNLKADICTTDAVLTAYFVVLVASFIPCIVRLIDAKSNCKNFVYKINPIYDDKIIFNIKVECIIRANLVHIISAIVKIIKEWRREENGRKSSNRRTYGHCYE